jgi:hypothetical protein
VAKVRVRKLWINVRFKAPQSYSRDEVIEELLRSVKRGHRTGDYSLPSGFHAILEWRNKPNVPMRRGPWETELENSAESSEGFDLAVIKYLEGQR